MASAVLLLAVVSTLVAFQGWPGGDLTDDVSSLVVDEPKRLAVDEPLQVAQNAAPAAAAVAGSPTPGTPASGTSAITPADVSTPPRPTEVRPLPPDDGRGDFRDDEDNGGGTNAPAGPDPDVEPPGLLLPETPLTPQVRRITDGLGDSTQGLTDDLGTKVGQLDPQLGQTVTDTGRILADLLRGLGRPR